MYYLYSFTPSKYFKENKLETFLICFAIIGILLKEIFGVEIITHIGNFLGYTPIQDFNYSFIKGYIFILLLIELGRIGYNLPSLNISPALLLVFSFLILIGIGTFILMLPQMTNTGESMPFFKALFTSISASCVTGLCVVDTATYFSAKGHFALMLLIQLGGLNIISFATIFAIFTKNKIGIKHQSIIQDNLATCSIKDSRSLLKKIFLFTAVIEGIGTIILFLSWGNTVIFENTLQKIFYALFHAISAFNNAGFSLFTDGLSSSISGGLYYIHIIIFVLIFLGGIGFAPLQELLNFNTFKKMFQRKYKLTMNTKFSLYISLALIITGGVLFFGLEYSNTLAEKSFFEKTVTSFFQSMTTRTAGFNTIDISELKTPCLMLMLFLMFIGASPGSTGGGVKTTAFGVLLIFIYSHLRGKRQIETAHHYISFKQLNKVVSILVFSICFIFVSIFILTITDDNIPIIKLIFEEVSAFSTVGLSMGITTDLSVFGKIILMISMFVGRVGTITIGIAFSKKLITTNYQYTKAIVQVN